MARRSLRSGSATPVDRVPPEQGGRSSAHPDPHGPCGVAPERGDGRFAQPIAVPRGTGRHRVGKRAVSATKPPAFVGYAGRHTKATDLLENGESTGAVAAILGHRDPTMVLKVYGKHIDKREEHLRECIEKGTKKYRSA
jgi:hypothetical protein